MKHPFPFALTLAIPALLSAQSTPEMKDVLDRLSRLEQENTRLNAEVKELREALTGNPIAESDGTGVADATTEQPAPVPLEERVAIQETRINELAHTSVQALQRMPISLTGMVLFNAFMNGSAGGGNQNPVIASLQPSTSGAAGGSLRQSIIGLRYQGPTILRGGRVSASLDMDLWGGSASSLNHLVRLRTATIQVDWANRSLMVGQDKPLIAQRDPSSLAQVAVSPLTASGNLWLWQPQTRFEQRFKVGLSSGIRAQASIYQTSEPNGGTVSNTYGTASSSRPALQGRFEYWSDLSERTRIEIAPGFHVSESRVGDTSIPSRLVTADWLIRPAPAWQFTGTFFKGENAAGLGGLRQGFSLINDKFVPVHTTGGWAQISFLPTSRLSLNVYGGQESNRPEDLLPTQISRNLAYAGNVMYRLGSNVRLAAEVSQVRTKYKQGDVRLVNHYDLAVAYLF